MSITIQLKKNLVLFHIHTVLYCIVHYTYCRALLYFGLVVKTMVKTLISLSDVRHAVRANPAAIFKTICL